VSTPAEDSAARDIHRAAVVDAMLTLLNEGPGDPSLTDVAARAGMSGVAVFTHFDGVDDLRNEVISLHVLRVHGLLAGADLRDGPLAARVRRFVEARVEFCATMAGTGRVAHSRASVPEIAGAVQRVRALWDDHARTQFAPELASLDEAQADDLVTTIDGLFLFDAWEDLVAVHGRTPEQIGRAWTRTLLALLSSDPKAGP
jgi:AcrR family transcriptional regulator